MMVFNFHGSDASSRYFVPKLDFISSRMAEIVKRSILWVGGGDFVVSPLTRRENSYIFILRNTKMQSQKGAFSSSV